MSEQITSVSCLGVLDLFSPNFLPLLSLRREEWLRYGSDPSIQDSGTRESTIWCQPDLQEKDPVFCSATP